MAIYNGTKEELLYALINESNPDLVEKRDFLNSRLSEPKARTPGPGEIQDTTIDIYARGESFYMGKRTVHYRRLNPLRLFANTTLYIDRWAVGNLSREEFVEVVRGMTGLPVEVSDIVYTIPRGTSNVKIAPNSKVFTGEFPVTWLPGKREVDQIITTTVIPGRVWDLNYDPNKPLMTLVGFGVDYSAIKRNLVQLPASATITPSLAGINTVLQFLTRYTGILFDPTVDHSVQSGVGGLTISRYALPNINLLEANSDEYNQAMVISSNASSWFCGKIIMHYNS